MADITMCDGVVGNSLTGDSLVPSECPKRETCYHYTAPYNSYRQSFFMLAPMRADGVCPEYEPNGVSNEN